MDKTNVLSEKLAGTASGASGVLSFLGGYNVCHNICLILIAGLSVMGISLQGMPLAFLQDYAVIFWVAAVTMLAVTLYLYKKHKCVSKHLLAANTGLLIAAVPFKELEFMQLGLWVVGFGLVFVSIYNYIIERRKRRDSKLCHTQTQ